MLKHDERIIELRRSGKSIDATADALGICGGTVVNCIRRHGLQGRYRSNKRIEKASKTREKRPNLLQKEPKTTHFHTKQYRAPFSLIVKGSPEFIETRILTVNKVQHDFIVQLLRVLGGELIYEDEK